MTAVLPVKTDAQLDLVLERVVDIPKSQIWKAWTTPELLTPWFCPKPWSVSECRIDLKPGGEFFTRMRGPEGEDMPNAGCYLEVIPETSLVWTNTLLPGFRPADLPAGDEMGCNFPFTGQILLEDHPTGAKYIAIARHATAADAQKHVAMGFEEGWGICLDQLVAFVKTW
ncbi:MAG: SRPBCC family protein [Candidatus Melainabacteria bacterium]